MGLYIITHKYLEKQIDKPEYHTLYVGAYKQQERKNNYCFDDVGDNISEKNSNYCELTGLYWLWKNCRDARKGIAHYRRFFTKNSFSANPRFYYGTDELNKYLETYDILVAERLYVPMENVYEDYCAFHYKKDIDALKELIEEKYPDYKETFNSVFDRSYYFPANMLYCSSKVFDSYCEWLFDILFELEKRIDITDYNTVQARTYGFIGERLLNVWVEKNQLNVKELRIVQTDSRRRLRIRKKLDRIAGRALTRKVKYRK